MKKHNTILEWMMVGTIGWVLFICTPFAKALEFQFDKNVAANVSAPLINSTTNNTFATGANNTNFYVHGANSSAAMGAFGIAGSNVSIIGTSGVYNFPLNATEMNYDRVGVYYNGTGCLQQYLEINTVPKEAIDGNTPTAVWALGTRTITGGNLSGTQAFNNTGNLIGNVSYVTNGVTVTTNNDKTGYTISGGNLTNPQTFNLTGNITGSMSGSVNSVTSGVTVTTNNDKTNYGIQAGNITTSTFASGAIDAAAIAANAITSSEFAQSAADVVWTSATRNITGGNLTNPQTFNLTGNITGGLSGAVGSVTGAVGSVTGNVGGNVGGNVNGTTASVVGAVGSVTGNVGGNLGGNVNGTVSSVTGAVGSVTGTIGGNLNGSVVGNVLGTANLNATLTG